MSRRRNQHADLWTLSRCKRILRPFLSKIHNLSDQCSKDPSILEFECSRSKLRLSATTRNGNKLKRACIKEPKSRRKHRKNLLDFYLLESELLEDERYDDENNVDPSSDMVINKLLKPASAQERLEGLEPLISASLYQAYVDIFLSFKSIVVSIELTRDQNKFTKLSDICCVEIGKAMVLTSKTSYFKLNQSLLFDPDELPQAIKLYHKHLLDDIDHWFELQPRLIFGKYTMELLVGYLNHLVLFHLQLTLYLLVPVLIHWLYEELIISGNLNLKRFLNRLFQGFWDFDVEKYYDNISTDAIITSMGLMPLSNRTFWQLFELGFWDHFISSFGFESQADSNQYENLMLNSLVRNDKFDLLKEDRLFMLLETTVYPMIERNPSNANINPLLIVILARTIKVANSLECEEFEGLLTHLKRFAGVWLSFGIDRPMVFNSLYPGNREIFAGLLKLTRFYHSRIKTLGEDTLEAECLFYGLSLLRDFFLETETSTHAKAETKSIHDGIMCIQTDKFRSLMPLTYSNRDFNDFVYWLLEHNHLALAKLLFQTVYGRYTTFYDTPIEDLYCILFT